MEAAVGPLKPARATAHLALWAALLAQPATNGCLEARPAEARDEAISSDGSAPDAGAAPFLGCVLTAQCARGLVCRDTRCVHRACLGRGECAPGETCVAVQEGGGPVCTMIECGTNGARDPYCSEAERSGHEYNCVEGACVRLYWHPKARR